MSYLQPIPAYSPPPSSGNGYWVHVQGGVHGPYPVEHVRTMVRNGSMAPSDPVSYAGQAWVPATSAPGVFSDRSYVAAILISLFLGGLGIDRFYLGYTGLGIAKLLLNWMTFGVWALIDLILIVLRKVPDSGGRPLR
jgi:hypothetical protein